MAGYWEYLAREEAAQQQFEDMKRQRGLLGRQDADRPRLLQGALDTNNQTANLASEIFGMAPDVAGQRFGRESYADQIGRGMPFAAQRFQADPRAQYAMTRPEVADQLIQSKLFPAPPKPIGALAPGAKYFGAPGPDGTAPVIADNQETPDILKPGVLDAEILKSRATRAPTTETWNNPVPEVGSDGRPIQVQYSNLGNRREIAGATPAKQGNSFDRQDYWRSQMKPFVDSATNARVQTSKVRTSLGQSTGTGHIAAINALQKMIDEGAVVRDQDVALIQSAQSLYSRLSSQIEGLKTGKLLSPELQGELTQVAEGLERAIYDGVNERVSAYEPVMGEEGVKMDSVVPPAMRKMFAVKKQAQPPGPPPIGKNGKPMKWVPE